MKKLIFIDNDSNDKSLAEIKTFVYPSLTEIGKLDARQVKEMEIISDLYKREANELYQLFYSGNFVIVSWSVYSVTSFSNSKQQLIRFLRMAGSSSVKNITYIDTSGCLKKTLSYLIEFDEFKGFYDVLKAIETNNIVTLSNDKFVRLRLDIANDVLREEEIDLRNFMQ